MSDKVKIKMLEPLLVPNAEITIAGGTTLGEVRQVLRQLPPDWVISGPESLLVYLYTRELL